MDYVSCITMFSNTFNEIIEMILGMEFVFKKCR